MTDASQIQLFQSLDGEIQLEITWEQETLWMTQFRIWATNIRKQHLVNGYTLNQKRLQEPGIEFDQAVQLLSQTLINQA